jgi:succinoglycan biosynthesis transport protein ExoP
MMRGDQGDRWGGEPGGRALMAAEGGRLAPLHGSQLPGGLREPHPGGREGSEIDLLQYWYLLLKHRYIVLGAVAAMLALGLLVTLLTTPIYRASALLQIEREAARVVDIEGVDPVEAGNDRDFYQTQYSLLNSRSLAERVVRRLNLANDARFMNQHAGGPLSSLTGGGGDSAPAGDRAARERRAVGLIAAGLSVEPVRSSRLVRVSYDSPDPELAQRVANAVAENFIGANLDRRFEASSYARKFLEERLAQVKSRLEDSERQLVAYASAQQLVSVMSDSGDSTSERSAAQSLTGVNLAAMNSALSAAKGERIRAEQRYRQAAGSNSLAIPEVLASGAVQSLRQSRAELSADYQQKLSVYKPDYPAMVALKAQIDEVDRQIATEVRTIKQSLQAEYRVAASQEAALQQQVSSLTSGVLDLRNRGIQYNIIQREVDTNRTLYDGLLQRYKEIGVAGGVGTNNISIVDRAQTPRGPYKPNLLINLALAGGFGLLLGFVGAVARESLDETIKRPEDIENKVGLPLLGTIPVLEKGLTPQEALADARSAFSEAYYSVRTALQFSTSEGVPSSILITSARPSEGKSTTAVALAQNFAKLGISVLLVDSDLRNPSLHRIVGCDNSAGLSNYLTSRTPLAQLVQPTDQPNLGIMPCGPLPPNPAELLAGPRVRALLKDVAESFDLLIIDGPPVMGLADAPLLASHAAGVMLVVESGSTRLGLVKTALRRLEVGHARMLGAVLTKFSVKQAGYGYGEGYGYAYAYNYDYGVKEITSKVS